MNRTNPGLDPSTAQVCGSAERIHRSSRSSSVLSSSDSGSTVSPERTTREFPAGTLLVPTAQRAGTLAVYLLEPHSDDGLCRWQFLDKLIQVGELYPIHRVVGSATAPKKAE